MADSLPKSPSSSSSSPPSSVFQRSSSLPSLTGKTSLDRFKSLQSYRAPSSSTALYASRHQHASSSDLPFRPGALCPHRGPCVSLFFRAFGFNFGAGCLLRVIINQFRKLVALRMQYLTYTRNTLANMMRSLRQGGGNISIGSVLGHDVVRFGLFLGGVAGMYKALTCLARNIFEEDSKLTSFSAGALSGVCIFFLKQEDRPAIAVYIWLRAMAILVRNASREYWFPDWMKRFRHWDTVAMTLATCQILYGYILEQDSLPLSYRRFLMSAGRKDIRIINGLKAIGRAEPLNKAALEEYCSENAIVMPPAAALVPENQSVLCDIMHPGQQCETHWLVFCLKHVFQYSLRFYLPLNIVGMLVFHRGSLYKDAHIVRMLISTLRSSLFLGVYCGNAWLVQCMMRRLGVYSGFMSWLFGGMGAGLATLIERKSRRTEIAIYTLSPAVQGFYRCMRMWGYWPKIHYLDGIFFSAAMGIILFNHEKKRATLSDTSPFLSAVTRQLF